MNYIDDIWEPRYHDRVVLVKTSKIVDGDNLISFTKSPAYPLIYKFEGTKAKTCPTTSNGKSLMYQIPLDWLQPYCTKEEYKRKKDAVCSIVLRIETNDIKRLKTLLDEADFIMEYRREEC